MDLDSIMQEAICSASAETILEIQHENIQNSFPGKSRHELHQYLKVISLIAYFHTCLTEVMYMLYFFAVGFYQVMKPFRNPYSPLSVSTIFTWWVPN